MNNALYETFGAMKSSPLSIFYLAGLTLSPHGPDGTHAWREGRLSPTTYDNCFDTDLRAFWLDRMRTLFRWSNLSYREAALAAAQLKRVPPITLRAELVAGLTVRPSVLGLFWSRAFAAADILDEKTWVLHDVCLPLDTEEALR